jgi:hypothetical protein
MGILVRGETKKPIVIFSRFSENFETSGTKARPSYVFGF